MMTACTGKRTEADLTAPSVSTKTTWTCRLLTEPLRELICVPFTRLITGLASIENRVPAAPFGFASIPGTSKVDTSKLNPEDEVDTDNERRENNGVRLVGRASNAERRA